MEDIFDKCKNEFGKGSFITTEFKCGGKNMRCIIKAESFIRNTDGLHRILGDGIDGLNEFLPNHDFGFDEVTNVRPSTNEEIVLWALYYENYKHKITIEVLRK